MPKVIVGKWGKSLAIRVPLDVAAQAGLKDGESVEIEARDGDIVIRRSDARDIARQKALAAVEGIRQLRGKLDLRGMTIQELRDEGRR